MSGETYAMACGVRFISLDSALRHATEIANKTGKVVEVSNVRDGENEVIMVEPDGIGDDFGHDAAVDEEQSGLGVEITTDDDELVSAITAIQREINERFEGSGEDELVGRIADWINRSTHASMEYFSKRAVPAPVGGDGKHVMPGDVVCHVGDEGNPELAFQVIAVDSVGNAYYNAESRLGQGGVPNSVAVCMQLVHAPFQSRRDVLNWFYHEMRNCDPNREDEITARAERMLEAF